MWSINKQTNALYISFKNCRQISGSMSKDIQKMSGINTKGKIINLLELPHKPQHLLCIFMMEYVLQSSNLHNVMETDTTAAKM